MSALEGGNPDEEDAAQKATRLAARAARFNKSAPGQRNKDLENARAQERKAFEAQGLINSGKTELTDAVEMRGTCESMCSPFEIETRNIRMEVHPFEKGPDDKLDPNKAVAAYTRSDAGAGHGDSAILPSDLRTPQALVRSLDYLFSKIMPTPPTAASSKSIDRKALGHTAGFIRDRTRAIRKEFAMQSSWGQAESIESHERIARWHILCLRELQEETGFNSDMHIDSAELGRCLTSLRQFYNDERERTGQETPCPNEPEMIAYMLIFDLANKSVSIPISELPGAILDQPIVKLAWEIRKTAQRNFDTQKGGSLHNSELGSNLITRYIRLLKQPDVPFLLSCMVEVRLREVRRSALRAMTRTYPRLKTDPIRYNDEGQIAERKMVLIESLDKILGCEEQDQEETAWQDVVPSSRKEDDEAVNVVSNFDLEVWPEKRNPVGSLINLGSPFDDNQDAPFTKRWKLITDKRKDMSLVHIVNGQTGVLMGSESGVPAKPRARPSIMPQATKSPAPSFSFNKPSAPATTASQAPEPAPVAPKPVANGSAFSFAFGKPSASTSQPTQSAFKPAASAKPAEPPKQPAALPTNLFGKKVVTFAPTPEPSPSPSPSLAPTPAVSSPEQSAAPLFSFKPTPPAPAKADPKPTSIPTFFESPKTAEPSKSPEPVAAAPTFSFKTPAAAPTTQPQISTSKAPEPVAPAVKPARKAPTLTDTQRRAQRKALPALRDRLIAEVVADKLSGTEFELASIVKQSRAARAYAEAKARRQEAVALYAQKAFDDLLEQVIEEAATQAYLAQIVRNGRLRAIVRRWRDWATMQREDREAATREREKAFEKLGSMGLTFSSLGISDQPMSLSSTLRSTDTASRMSTSTIGRQRSHSRTHVHEKIDPFAADVMLHQTERSKDHFYSTATFLATTARFVAPLLQPASPISSTFTFDTCPASGREIYFRTLLSPSRDSATPSSDTAFEWLRSKIFPATDDCYTQDGVTFDAEVMGRYDEISKSTSLGLLVFEAPLQTWSSEKTRSNAADAQDRIMQLHELANKEANEYSPVLLILTWEEETLDEVSERLGLKDALESFDKVGSLSLESAEDLDERFAKVLETLLAESPLRQQVVIDLRDAANRMWPSWERLLTTIRLAIPFSGQDVDYVSHALKFGIEALNESITIVRSALGGTEICETSTFDPPTLPPFTYERTDSSDISGLAEVIAEYLQDDFFADYSDVSLYIAPLRQAAYHSRALPVDGILQSLGVMMFSEIATERLPIRAFYPTESGVEEYKTNYLDSVHSGYEHKVDHFVSTLASIQSQSQPHLTATHDESTTKTTITLSPKGSRTLKRTHSRASLSAPNDENRSPRSPRKVLAASQIKALKNAKLLKALRDVEKTLGSMEVEEQQRLNEVF